jgi:glycine betaine/proline transport system permease protein
MDFIESHKIPVGRVIEDFITFLRDHADWLFDLVSDGLRFLIDGLIYMLLSVPPLALIAIIAAGAFWLHRSRWLVVGIVLSLLLVINLGYWAETTETLALVVVRHATCMVIGVPVGIAAAHRPWLFAALAAGARPDADHPDLRLSDPDPDPLRPRRGAGPDLDRDLRHPGADPPDLSRHLLGAAPADRGRRGLRRHRTQLLWKVELPHALPTIMAGLTQCIMLSLSMVVIAALVGAAGLGVPVVRALNTVNIARASRPASPSSSSPSSSTGCASSRRGAKGG